MLEETIKNKNEDNEHVKKLQAIRKLDAFNYMLSNNILHKDIKIQNILIQPINRLQDVRQASDISILRSYKNSKKIIQAHFSYEVEKGFSRIKDHLQVFRPTILELDNQKILQRQSIQHEHLTETYQENEILSQFNITCQTNQYFKQYGKKQTQSNDLFNHLTGFDERTIKNNVPIQQEKLSKKISLVGRK
ncbi:hypothetical protein ABPG73_017083 [Tetrahymena malaccensis]